MALVLIVEDGTGIEDANSYIDLDYMSTYAALQGAEDTWCNNSSKQILALIQASQFIDLRYSSRFCGELVNSDQGLLFPRKIKGQEKGIPKALKQATASLALQYITDGTLDLNANSDAAVRSTSVSVGNGAVQESITYYDDSSVKTAFSAFAVTDRYINQLMRTVGCEANTSNLMFIEAWRS